jgi:hypothetical protein
MASRADKYKLYEQSVQCPGADIDFIDDTFRSLKKRSASRLREDFCGTAANSCEWVRRRAGNLAIAVDHDPFVLEWARQHHVSGLTGDQRRRLHLLTEDVMYTPDSSTVEVTLALNFSYWVFRDRETLKRYFRKVCRSLTEDGILFLDAFGGYEAYREMRERTTYRHFTYTWEQSSYDPVTGDYTCKIHFRFNDGSMLRDAFVYHWRLWTLPELTGMLADTGFRPSVYWEGTASDGGGNGVYQPAARGEADASWIAYIVAEKC